MDGAGILLVVAVVYFLPSIISAGRGHHNNGAIFALNLLLGWTLLGWVAALVWSLTAVNRPEGAASPAVSRKADVDAHADRGAPVELPLIGVLPGWVLPMAGLGFVVILIIIAGASSLLGGAGTGDGLAAGGGIDRAALAARGSLTPLCNEALASGAQNREITGGVALRVTDARAHDDDRLIACVLAERNTDRAVDYVLLAWRVPFGPAGQQTRYAGFEDLDGTRLAEGPTMADLEDVLTARRAAEAEARRGQHWRYSSSRSEMTDFTNHYLWVSAEGELRDRYGRRISPTLQIRCQENTTSLYVSADEFLSIDAIRVEYRIDDRAARTDRWSVSTDYQAAGHWRGAGAIPLLRQLVDANADRLVLRYTPHGSSSRTVIFDVSGLDRRITPVRQACGW